MEDNPFTSVPIPDPNGPDPFTSVPIPDPNGPDQPNTNWWEQPADSEFASVTIPPPTEEAMPVTTGLTYEQQADREAMLNRELELPPVPESFIPKPGVVVEKPEKLETIIPWKKAGLPIPPEYYSDLAAEAVGWKLHLNFDATDAASVLAVQNCIDELTEMGLTGGSKIGNGGGEEAGAPGKEATISVGHKDDALKVAKLINQKLGNVLLPQTHKEVTDDDIPFDGPVWGRFDVMKMDDDFTKSGGNGHQALKEDVGGLVAPGGRYKGLDGAEARAAFWDDAVARAEPLLAYRYGEFFTGTDQPNTAE